jgi:glucokinase
VIDGVAQITNLPWTVNEKEIVEAVGTSRIRLVNDLVATTAALPHFQPEDLLVVHEGRGHQQSGKASCAVLAPGTGLGQAILYWDPETLRYTVHASEGGHADLAPCNEIEIELLRYLQGKYNRVSYERVLSGPGLVNIYSFLKEEKYAAEPEDLRKRMQNGDPAAVISKAGLAGEFDICVKALDIFAAFLGAQAGNLVITLLATGGVYLGGGIPPKIHRKLCDGTLQKAYLNKGRLVNLVRSTPIYIIKDDHAALLGAAHLAESMRS